MKIASMGPHTLVEVPDGIDISAYLDDSPAIPETAEVRAENTDEDPIADDTKEGVIRFLEFVRQKKASQQMDRRKRIIFAKYARQNEEDQEKGIVLAKVA